MLGKFGFHPDPAVDFCVEVDVLGAMVYDVHVGLESRKKLEDRVFKALQFNVGGVPEAVAAKGRLRAIDAMLKGA